MPRGRRKVPVVVSDDEAVPQTQTLLRQSSVTTPENTNLEPTDISEPETPLASKKPRLSEKPSPDHQQATRQTGTRSAKARALSNAIWLANGATSDKQLELLPTSSHSENIDPGNKKGQVPAKDVKRSRITAQNMHMLPPVKDQIRDSDFEPGSESENSCLNVELESDDPEFQKVVGAKAWQEKFTMEHPVWTQPVEDHQGGGTGSRPMLATISNLSDNNGSVPLLRNTSGNKKTLKKVQNGIYLADFTATSDMPVVSAPPVPLPPPHASVPPPPPTQAQYPPWPPYTNLQQAVSGDYTLNVQHFEIKAVVRKAFPFIYAKLSFIDFYPTLAMRASWARRVLVRAANEIKELSHNVTTAASRYEAIKDWLKRDADYSTILGRLLDQRIPIFQNNLKSYAAQAIIAHFGLHSNCGDRVEWLMSKMCYIYPCDVQNRKVDTKRPYQNTAITSSISVYYFTRSSDIINNNAAAFRPSEPEYQEDELPDSMIALTSTAIYAGLSEWRTGRHSQLDFSANAFSSVYNAHMALLARIRTDNPHGYHMLKAKLYRLAQDLSMGNSSNLQEDAIDLLDTKNIAVD